jgi:hypothetical protein
VVVDKRFALTLAKTVFLAIPLILAYILGVDFVVEWLFNARGVRLPHWLASIVMLIGVFGIIVLTIGSDLTVMRRTNDQKRAQERKPD